MFANIQLLRAIAAILVLLHHAVVAYDWVGGRIDALRAIARWGFVGVDLFFVVSGFVIAATTLDKPRTRQSAEVFARNRLARIYLGYWPFFAAMLLVMALFAREALAQKHIVRSFLLLSTDHTRLVLPVAWSLAYELYFYAWSALSFRVSRRGAIVGAHVGFLAILGVAWIGRPQQDLLYFVLGPELLEFLAGGLVYVHRARIAARPWLVAALVLVGVGSAAYGVHIAATNDEPRVFTFGIAAVATVAVLVSAELRARCVAGGIARAIGDASYTLYLAHPVVLALVPEIKLRWLLRKLGPVGLELGFLAWLALIVVACVYYYRKVEAPVYARARTPPPARGDGLPAVEAT